MSIPSGKRISICDQEFCHYNDLARHMKYLINAHLKGTNEVPEDHLIKALKAFKKSLVYGENVGAYEYLLKENFPEFCVKLLRLSVENNKIKLLSSVLSCIITITDNSKAMCEVLVKAGLPNLIIRQTIQVSDKLYKLPKSVTVDDLMAQLILIVDNIANDTRFQQSFIQNENIKLFKDSILPYMKSKDKRMAILTMAALTWLIEDDESVRSLEFYCKIIENFVEFINSGLRDANRRCEGLRISEMLEVLKSLSCIETIKNSMIKMSSLMSMIHKIASSKNTSLEESKIALGILYNLILKDPEESEEDFIKKPKTDDFNQIEVVAKSLSNSLDPGVKKVADSVISELKGVLKDRNVDPKYDIFISYCPEDKQKMFEVENYLKSSGLKVCIEDSGALGSSPDQVKRVIEQSRTVIAGISNSYFHNQFCRSDCQYAFKSKKPIIPVLVERKYRAKDWLHKVIIKETCVDFSEDIDYKKLVDALSKYIEIKEKDVDYSMSKGIESVSLCQSNTGYKSWTNIEVSEWLRKNDISSIQSKIPKLDGKILKYLKEMKTSSLAEYSKRLKDDLQLSFGEEMAFTSAIDDLNDN